MEKFSIKKERLLYWILLHASRLSETKEGENEAVFGKKSKASRKNSP